jgi:2-oxoglutarate ferredoxin oxidoreductase subunit delta
VCVEACPPKCLLLLADLNAYGVHPAYYTGENCSGCGICFYVFPEPGAIAVYRLIVPKTANLKTEVSHAATL